MKLQKKISKFIIFLIMSLNGMERPEEKGSYLREVPLELIQRVACHVIKGSQDLKKAKENYIKLVKGYTGEFDFFTRQDVELFSRCLKYKPLYVARKLNLDDIYKELFSELTAKYTDLNERYNKLNQEQLYNKLDEELGLAVKSNDKELVKILLEAGADPDYTTQDETPILMEVLQGKVDKDIIKLLVDSGFDYEIVKLLQETYS